MTYNNSSGLNNRGG